MLSFLTEQMLMQFLYIIIGMPERKIAIRCIRSSYKERMVDALALGADEGRGKLR